MDQKEVHYKWVEPLEQPSPAIITAKVSPRVEEPVELGETWNAKTAIYDGDASERALKTTKPPIIQSRDGDRPHLSEQHSQVQILAHNNDYHSS